MVLDLVPLVVALLAVTAIYKVATLTRGFIPAQAALAAVFVALAVGIAPFAGLHTGASRGHRHRPWLGRRRVPRVHRTRCRTGADLPAPARPPRRRGGAACPTTPRRLRHRRRLRGRDGCPDPKAARFGSGPLDAWPEVTMHGVFLAYVAVALADVAVSAARWARASSGSMRLGLSLIAAGAGCAIAYAVTKGVGVGVEAAGGDPPAWMIESARAAALIGLTMVSIGCVLPALARGLRAARQAVRAHQHAGPPLPAVGGPRRLDARNRPRAGPAALARQTALA